MYEKVYTFNRYLQETFGERIHRISLNADFGCPNFDGRISDKGCLYCNNKAFAYYSDTKLSLDEQIQESISFYSRRFGVRKFIAYFHAFTSTAADCEQLQKKYDVIKKFPQIVGLAISTRPDCVDEEKIKLISSYKDKYLVWIEYGLQTTDNKILSMIDRNHTYEDFLSALALTRSYGINVGAHLILGLPGSSRALLMRDIERLSALDIQGLKFHVLHVLKDTPLEGLYQQGEVKLLEEKEYVKLLCDCLEYLPKTMVILRMLSNAWSDTLIGPLWINDKNRIIREITQELVQRKTYQGYYHESAHNKSK